MSEALVSFENVSAAYGGEPVLDRFQLQVERGAVYALLGRNGEGKTTAVRCLLGLERTTAGRVRLGGLDPWTQRRRALAGVGFVPEEPDAPPALDVRALGALARDLSPRWDAAGYAAHLERARVPPAVPFARLSRGQKAHVGLALALAASPDLLVLDDPTLGLDHVARRTFYEEIIRELSDRGVTILLTSHDISAVERIATHVGVLRGGRLAVDMELEALKAGFRRVRVARPEGRRAALAAGRPLKVEAGLWGVEAVLADFKEARFEHALSSGSDAEVTTMSLEEIFAAVTDSHEEVAS